MTDEEARAAAEAHLVLARLVTHFLRQCGGSVILPVSAEVMGAIFIRTWINPADGSLCAELIDAYGGGANPSALN